MARAARQPVIIVVADNKAAEALEPLLRAGCELTGAIDPAQVVRLPEHDVLPFENLSPHPDVQEQRASALWKLATGAVSILIAPVESAALKLFDRDYYAGLAVTLKRGEEVDVEVLTGHLASVGYTQIRRKPTGPFALSFLATRLKPSASSILKRSARKAGSMRRSCCR
jgi:transcription-repair coupling factor (superfamily II helicase)